MSLIIAQVLLSKLCGEGGRRRFRSVWKQLTRISMKQHCVMLRKLRLKDCSLNGYQVNLGLILKV
jgi:hypothetical protein